jgi:hypothetical protein
MHPGLGLGLGLYTVVSSFTSTSESSAGDRGKGEIERAREKVAMAGTAKTVKDVPSHDFVRAYAAHLKRSGKVSYSNSWNWNRSHAKMRENFLEALR